MKLFSYSLIAFLALVFVGCNKDEELIIENGGQEEETPQPPSRPLAYEVVEYLPAPGQYINEAVTGFNNIFTMEEAVSHAQERLSKGLYVSLGSWGGTIIVKFNDPVVNSGGYDFSISSNTFDSSNEPGIVWVMQDANHNGKPDDEWYELKGSHFGEEGYERNYWVRYERPGAKENTPWEDSNGETGYIYWSAAYHPQDFYYPNWVKEDSYTLYGSRLPLQAVQDPVTQQWTNLPFAWGYVDNNGEDFLKDGNRNQFRISDAVTNDNLPINLPAIDFVKVQTAVNGNAGWLGENSTEVCGFFVE